jgi:hypothetical protein
MLCTYIHTHINQFFDFLKCGLFCETMKQRILSVHRVHSIHKESLELSYFSNFSRICEEMLEKTTKIVTKKKFNL